MVHRIVLCARLVCRAGAPMPPAVAWPGRSSVISLVCYLQQRMYAIMLCSRGEKRRRRCCQPNGQIGTNADSWMVDGDRCQCLCQFYVACSLLPATCYLLPFTHLLPFYAPVLLPYIVGTWMYRRDDVLTWRVHVAWAMSSYSTARDGGLIFHFMSARYPRRSLNRWMNDLKSGQIIFPSVCFRTVVQYLHCQFARFASSRVITSNIFYTTFNIFLFFFFFNLQHVHDVHLELE